MLDFLMDPETFAVFALLSLANALIFLTRAWLALANKVLPPREGYLVFTYVNLLIFMGYVLSMAFVKFFVMA